LLDFYSSENCFFLTQWFDILFDILKLFFFTDEIVVDSVLWWAFNFFKNKTCYSALLSTDPANDQENLHELFEHSIRRENAGESSSPENYSGDSS
jgi:hypothetical protein